MSSQISDSPKRREWKVDPLDLSDRRTAARVFEIQRAAYGIEADLIGFDGIPVLAETLADLRGSASLLEWAGIRSEGSIVAAMATRSDRGVREIDRLVVDPAWFRCGLARALVSTLADRGSVTVSTGTANLPAIELYESMGFTRDSTEAIAPGVTITHLRRTR